ncbi:hypothetical protein FOA52_008200 [Chlamydomonas sp. UWO 241]|nr:hypothetical protein FOA52_008200 [Chlamydomonas sp. UWO 241]
MTTSPAPTPSEMHSPLHSPSMYSTSLMTQAATSKLEHVSERFASLWTDIEAEKQARRLAENSKARNFTESLARVEKGLETEVQRRADSDKQLQTYVEDELAALSERCASQNTEMRAVLEQGIDALSARVQELHTALREEREQRKRNVEHLATSMMGKVNECVAVLDDERSNRTQEQATVLARFGEDIVAVQARLDKERATRDAELSSLRSEVHNVLGSHNEADAQFKATSLEEMGALKAALHLEREERIAEDDEIVQAINDYTKALQEGLKLVSN